MSDCGIRFMNNNLATATNSTFTSESSTYPSANAFNTDRNNLFRFDGYFIVTVSSNDKLYINDGSLKSITLDAGEYTGATLATEIQTQLNASSSGYTVTHDAGGNSKFKIVKASGTSQLLVSNQTNAVWDDIGFTGSTDRTGALTYTAEETRIHMYETILVDLGVSTQVQAVLAVDQLDEIFTISADATVTIEANNVDLWTAAPLSESVTRTDRGLFKHFSNDTDTYYRYWRLKIIDRRNMFGGIGFGYLYIGGSDQLGSTNLARGFSRSRVDPSIITTSESGQKFADTRIKFEKFTGMSITNLIAADKDRIEVNFEDFGTTEPFFISLDPLLQISTVEDEYTRLVRFAGPPNIQQLFLNYYTMSLAFDEVI